MPRGRLQLSLPELAVALGIGAIVLAVFVPTFLGQLRTNKILEASEQLQVLTQHAATYYATSWDGGFRRCLPSPAGPTPASPTVDAEVVDFFASSAVGHASWEALGFQPDRSIRYSYSFLPSDSGCGLGEEGANSEIVFRAEGDLDGDGVMSRFERRAIPTFRGVLEPVEELHVDQRVE